MNAANKSPFGVTFIRASLCAVGVLLGSAAQAATLYTNEASFIAAVGPGSLPLPVGPTGGDFTVSGFSVTATPPSSFVIDTAVYGQAIPGENNLLINGTEDFSVAAPAGIYAFGFSIYRPANASPIPGDPRGPVACYYTCGTDPFTVALYDGATLVNSFTFTPVQDVIEFYGYWGSTAFDSVQVIEGGSYPANIGDEYFANFLYGDVAQVPEPGSLALLGVGIASVGFIGRRKMKWGR